MVIALLSILFVICIILLIFSLWECKKHRRIQQQLRKETEKLEHSNYITAAILKNVEAFVLLIDNNLKVLKTNYYQKTNTRKEGDNKKVGDLLKCHNALSSKGGCGTSQFCPACPIRNTITQAFIKKRNFSNLEANLSIVVSENNSVECFTTISGSYFLVNGEENMVITVHDITLLKEAQRVLKNSKEEAMQSNRLKSAFLANMSQEIRTPLNAIIGFSEMLSTTDKKEEKQHFQEIIKTNADLLMNLANEIRDLSKIETENFELSYSVVDMNSVLSDVKQLFQMRTNSAKHMIEIITEHSSTDYNLQTDRNQVIRVMSNLIENALQFTSEESIHIGYETRKTDLYIYVKDTGKEELHTETNGVGLGLSISRAIVNKLGGKIGVNSVKGEGSTFWFTIPYSVKPNSKTNKLN